MKTFPVGFLPAGQVTNLQICWRVILRSGREILGTEHDRNIPITTGAYAGVYLSRAAITGSDIRSTADMSVDNLEVVGALPEASTDTADTSGFTIDDLNAADIEAGEFDNADVVTFIVNADDPDLYQDVLRTGWVGSITRKAEGEYRTELRGLTQALSQGIVRTFGVGCDAELGDARCKVAMGPFTFTGSVTAIVVSRREFTVTLSGAPAAGDLIAGKITFSSGLNDGYAKEIREDTPNIRVFDKFPKDIQVGDTFTVTAGCQKRLIEDCQVRYNNVLNFRGHGVFVPGDTEVIKVGKR